MSTMPARISAMGASMRRSGIAPLVLRPSSGTVTGTSPTISDVTAMPIHCTEVATSAK